MLYKLWYCLSYESKLALMIYQRTYHNKHWNPPPDEMPCVVKDIQPSKEIELIMQATPEQVTHNLGVFRD
jgi:hypothetical protein